MRKKAKPCEHVWKPSKTNDQVAVCKKCGLETYVANMAPPKFDQAAIDETAADAARAKKEFEAARDYVLGHYQRLKGQWIPVEVMNIQNVPSHNCLIVNDLLLLNYVEAKELLEQVTDD